MSPQRPSRWPLFTSALLTFKRLEIRNLPGNRYQEDDQMAAYVIFDVEIRDMAQYQEFMKGVKPAIEEAGGRYLARGGTHKVHEGDWQPRRIVILEFPSIKVRVLL